VHQLAITFLVSFHFINNYLEQLYYLSKIHRSYSLGKSAELDAWETLDLSCRWLMTTYSGRSGHLTPRTVRWWRLLTAEADAPAPVAMLMPSTAYDADYVVNSRRSRRRWPSPNCRPMPLPVPALHRNTFSDERLPMWTYCILQRFQPRRLRWPPCLDYVTTQ